MHNEETTDRTCARPPLLRVDRMPALLAQSTNVPLSNSKMSPFWRHGGCRDGRYAVGARAEKARILDEFSANYPDRGSRAVEVQPQRVVREQQLISFTPRACVRGSISNCIERIRNVQGYGVANGLRGPGEGTSSMARRRRTVRRRETAARRPGPPPNHECDPTAGAMRSSLERRRRRPRVSPGSTE